MLKHSSTGGQEDYNSGDNTNSEVGESDVTQSSRDTPKAEAHGVTFDFGQRNPDDDASGDARPALDFKTVFRSP